MAWRRVLVLGGARSGKSSFAQRLAIECGGPVLFVATATPGDVEMLERIARHRAERPPDWRTLEVPLDVSARVRAELTCDLAGGVRTTPDAGDRVAVVVVVEDLTLLLSNLIAASEAQAEPRAVDEVQALTSVEAHVILVSNEVGMGVVPPYPLGRAFRDALGRLNQATAALCSEVYLIVAGLPLRLK